MKRTVFEILFLVSAAAYIFTLQYNPYDFNFLVKAFPVWCLLLISLISVKGRDGRYLALGLFLSSLGDIALSFSRPKDDGIWFITGLAFFLLAHICYIILFSREVKFRKQLLPLMTAVCMYSLVMLVMLINSPKALPLIVPIMAYLFVITTMGLFSFLRYPAPWYLIAGAVFFIASDSLLAIHNFMRGIIGAPYFIMITYYIAQYLIARSFVAISDAKKSQAAG